MQRPATPGIFQANLLLGGALLIGLLMALFLGMTVGESDFLPLILIVAALMAILFAVSLYQYVWQIAVFLLLFGFNFRPTSFAFGALELGCALGLAVVGLFFWQKKTFQRPEILNRPAFRLVERMLFVWLAYVALHMVFNIKAPVSPGEFKLTNAVKSYFGFSAPLLVLFLFARTPAGLVVRKDFFWTIARLCLFGLLINLGLRGYELIGGWPPFIPIVNGTWDDSALRSIGPVAMLIGIVGLTGQGRRGLTLRWTVYCMLLVLGTVGSTLSGGRAVVVFGFLEVCVVLVLRRKVAVLGVVLFLAIVGIAALNFASSWINQRANPFLQRSVQWLMIEKNWQTVASLESSTEWRKELAHRALDEWRSDPRIFWTGRATFGFGVADETAILIAGGYEALIQTSLRRGATHNMTTDLLVAYGLIGCLVYFLLYFTIVRFLWQLIGSKQLSPPGRDLVLCCFVGGSLSFFLGILTGGIYPPTQVWLLVILIGGLYSGQALAPRAEPLPSADKAEAPAVRLRARFRRRGLVRHGV